MRLACSTRVRLLRARDGTVHCPAGRFGFESGRYAPLLEVFDEVRVVARSRPRF